MRDVAHAAPSGNPELDEEDGTEPTPAEAEVQRQAGRCTYQ